MKNTQAQLEKDVQRYAEIQKKINELTKEQKPIKERILKYAEEADFSDTQDMGAILIVPKCTIKETINPECHKDLPNWLWRLQQGGYLGAIKMTPDRKFIEKNHNQVLDGLLDEVAYHAGVTASFQIRLNVI